MGYYDEAYSFFEFCKRALHPSGYLMHKYRADGALGSSWHPYVHGSEAAAPIQEDETALVVFVFTQLYSLSKDNSLIKNFYHSMIKPMANFMAEFIDETTGLPKQSYDLWEERFAINTHTVAVTYAALLAASELAITVGDDDSAVKWSTAATDIQQAAKTKLYNSERGALYRALYVNDGVVTPDPTLDTAAIFGSFMFGLFNSNSPEISSSIALMEQVFNETPFNPGLPRYENDSYRNGDPQNSLGNWWYITTLWKAHYNIETGSANKAHESINWIHRHMLGTSVMGEQITPGTENIISPAPLTWSHAEYVGTLIDLL